MIALLAAVPEETQLIRERMQSSSVLVRGGLTITTGMLSGHNVCLTHSGVGKAAAAASAITLLSYEHAAALCLFGCGGAFPNTGVNTGDLALANSEIFGDEGVTTQDGFQDLATMGLTMRQDNQTHFNTWPVDQKLHDWAKPLLRHWTQGQGTQLAVGPFVTVSTCTGTTAKAIDIQARTAGVCENMEGAAVALACRQMSVPMLELRGISNIVEDRDLSRWDLPAGMAAAQEALLCLLDSWQEH